MTDIVDDMRIAALRCAGGVHSPEGAALRAAAAEIERLRDADIINGRALAEQKAEIELLRAERDALNKRLNDFGAELLDIGREKIAAENERDALRELLRDARHDVENRAAQCRLIASFDGVGAATRADISNRARREEELLAKIDAALAAKG